MVKSMTSKQDQNPELVSPADYIGAISRHVSSVCVITTELNGERFGLTATAVSSVSAEPPRLLICVNRNGFTHQKIIEAKKFCVNVLGEDQDPIAKVFAGMSDVGDDRFAIGTWKKFVTGAPVLADAVASFDCVLAEISEQSSHSVIFGDVVATGGTDGRDTLLYGGRRFRQLRSIYQGQNGYGEYL